jgi:hypothetical protein
MPSPCVSRGPLLDSVTMRHALGLVLACATACGPRLETVRLPPVDPTATFVAHSVHGGLAIDRLGDGASGRLEARSFGMFILRRLDTPVAALWLTGPSAVVARAATSATAPVTATVVPSWAESSIRLGLACAGTTLAAGPFVRTDGRSGLPTLSRIGQTSLDTRGSYRAPLQDEHGSTHGWFEVRVPGPDDPRVFSGSLSETCIEAGPALALALVSELDWIDDNTLDVYRGLGQGRDGLGHAR